VRQLRILIVVLAVDLFTAFGQVMLQIPQIRRLLDLVGHLLRFLNHFVQLATQSSVESCAGDGFFRFRPRRLVLLGIRVLGRRWAAHVPILRGAFYSLPKWLFYRLADAVGRNRFAILLPRLHVHPQFEAVVHRASQVLLAAEMVTGADSVRAGTCIGTDDRAVYDPSVIGLTASCAGGVYGGRATNRIIRG
jgi:hypothetical protein